MTPQLAGRVDGMKITTAKSGNESGNRYFENFGMQIVSSISDVVSF